MVRLYNYVPKYALPCSKALKFATNTKSCKQVLAEGGPSMSSLYEQAKKSVFPKKKSVRKWAIKLMRESGIKNPYSKKHDGLLYALTLKGKCGKIIQRKLNRSTGTCPINI